MSAGRIVFVANRAEEHTFTLWGRRGGVYRAHVSVIDSLNNSDCPGGSVACFMMGGRRRKLKKDADSLSFGVQTTVRAA